MKKKNNMNLGDNKKDLKAKKIASMYRSRRTKTYDDEQSGHESDEGDLER